MCPFSYYYIHPDIEDFFEDFEENDEYIPLDWLRKIIQIYPDVEGT